MSSSVSHRSFASFPPPLSSFLTPSVLSFSLVSPLLCVRWHYWGEYPFWLLPSVHPELHCFHLHIKPTVLLPSSIRLQLLSSLILFCHYMLSQRIGPTKVCPWGTAVYSLLPLLSFSLPPWTPGRELLIEASTHATSCSSATTDNWTRHSQITLFSFSPNPSLWSFLYLLDVTLWPLVVQYLR